MTLYLREDIAAAWAGKDPFAQARVQDGDIYRAREGRRTLRFEANGRSYFLKYHAGIGHAELFKNLLQFKLPAFSAAQEYAAINACTAAGVDTMTVAGFGVRGCDPARRESFIITDDLVNTISLEDVATLWQQNGAPLKMKRRLLERVAHIVATMHGAGVNHRDLYLAHFLIPQAAVQAGDADAPLNLIDLHRSQVRARVPWRWRVKDLGGLYFSAAPLALTKRDLYRFMCIYSGLPLRQVLKEQGRMWQAVRCKGERIFRRDHGTAPDFPLRLDQRAGRG